MTKDDTQFLARVAKEAPEVLEADINGADFEKLVKRLANTPPVPKQKRRKRRPARKK
jgi:hypothetical protein